LCVTRASATSIHNAPQMRHRQSNKRAAKLCAPARVRARTRSHNGAAHTHTTSRPDALRATPHGVPADRGRARRRRGRPARPDVVIATLGGLERLHLRAHVTHAVRVGAVQGERQTQPEVLKEVVPKTHVLPAVLLRLAASHGSYAHKRDCSLGHHTCTYKYTYTYTYARTLTSTHTNTHTDIHRHTGAHTHGRANTHCARAHLCGVSPANHSTSM
jgi:hypothetical protein